MPTERQLFQSARQKDAVEKQGYRKQEKGEHYHRPEDQDDIAQPGEQDHWRRLVGGGGTVARLTVIAEESNKVGESSKISLDQ